MISGKKKMFAGGNKETKIREESVQEIKVLEKCGVVNKNIHTKPLK